MKRKLNTQYRKLTGRRGEISAISDDVMLEQIRLEMIREQERTKRYKLAVIPLVCLAAFAVLLFQPALGGVMSLVEAYMRHQGMEGIVTATLNAVRDLS